MLRLKPIVSHYYLYVRVISITSIVIFPYKVKSLKNLRSIRILEKVIKNHSLITNENNSSQSESQTNCSLDHPNKKDIYL